MVRVSTEHLTPLTVKQFMDTMAVGRPKVMAALTELKVPIDLEVISGNFAEVLSPEVQSAIFQYLNIVPPFMREEYRKRGYLTTNELRAKLGLPKKAFFHHLEAAEPDWRTKFPTIAQGQRRTAFLPSSVEKKIVEYDLLENELQLLAGWRSLRQRGHFHVYINLTLPQIMQKNASLFSAIIERSEAQALKKYVKLKDKPPQTSAKDHLEMRKSIYWHTVAQKLRQARRVVTLTADDLLLFDEIAIANTLSLTHLKLTYIKLVFDEAQRTSERQSGADLDFLVQKGFLFVQELIEHNYLLELPEAEYSQVLTIRIREYLTSLAVSPNP